MDFNLNYVSSWETSPGIYSQEMVIPHLTWPIPDNVSFQTAFMAEVRWNIPTCLRYSNTTLLKNGRVIASAIEEEGAPGEPGWVWRFYVTEPVEGEVTWRVETRDCAKT